MKAMTNEPDLKAYQLNANIYNKKFPIQNQSLYLQNKEKIMHGKFSACHLTLPWVEARGMAAVTLQTVCVRC